jgi:hypothetical protein
MQCLTDPALDAARPLCWVWQALKHDQQQGLRQKRLSLVYRLETCSALRTAISCFSCSLNFTFKFCNSPGCRMDSMNAKIQHIRITPGKGSYLYKLVSTGRCPCRSK